MRSIFVTASSLFFRTSVFPSFANFFLLYFTSKLSSFRLSYFSLAAPPISPRFRLGNFFLFSHPLSITSNFSIHRCLSLSSAKAEGRWHTPNIIHALVHACSSVRIRAELGSLPPLIRCLRCTLSLNLILYRSPCYTRSRNVSSICSFFASPGALSQMHMVNSLSLLFVDVMRVYLVLSINGKQRPGRGSETNERRSDENGREWERKKNESAREKETDGERGAIGASSLSVLTTSRPDRTVYVQTSRKNIVKGHPLKNATPKTF